MASLNRTRSLQKYFNVTLYIGKSRLLIAPEVYKNFYKCLYQVEIQLLLIAPEVYKNIFVIVKNLLLIAPEGIEIFHFLLNFSYSKIS